MIADTNVCSIILDLSERTPAIYKAESYSVFHTVSICAQIIKFQIFGLSAQQLEDLVIATQ